MPGHEHAIHPSVFMCCLGLMSSSLFTCFPNQAAAEQPYARKTPVSSVPAVPQTFLAMEPLPSRESLSGPSGGVTVLADFAPSLLENDGATGNSAAGATLLPELAESLPNTEVSTLSLENAASIPEYLPPLSETLLDGLNFGAFPSTAAKDTTAPRRFYFAGIPLNVRLSTGLGFNDLDSQHGASPSGASSRYLSNLDQDTGNGFEGTLGGSIGFSFGGRGKPNVRASYEIGYRYPFQEEETTSGGERSKDLDHRFSFVAGLPLGRVNLRASVFFSRRNGADRDAGGDTQRTSLTVTTGMDYRLSSKTLLNLDVSVPLEEVEGNYETRSLTATAYLNYKFDRKLNGALGLSGGVEKSSGAEDQTFQQALLRMGFTPSPRLSFSARGGWEFRQLESADKAEPVFNISADWTPREGSSISLRSERSVENSAAIESANFVTTSLSLSLRQRLGSKVTLTLSGAYEHAVYGSAEDGSDIGRTDHLFTGQFGLEAPLGRRCSTSLSYNHAFNDSATDGFRSSRAQFSLTLQF